MVGFAEETCYVCGDHVDEVGEFVLVAALLEIFDVGLGRGQVYGAETFTDSRIDQGHFCWAEGDSAVLVHELSDFIEGRLVHDYLPQWVGFSPSDSYANIDLRTVSLTGLSSNRCHVSYAL